MNRIALAGALSALLAFPIPVLAQKQSTTPTSSLCTRDYAIDTTKNQILVSRTFDNVVQRVGVLLRAADLLWPQQRDKALAAYTEAFDLAVEHFKETGDEERRVSQAQFAARVALPDQRFKVISALAKRDPATARILSEQILQQNARDAEQRSAANDQSARSMSEKLLLVAYEMLKTDISTALTFARYSFRYPATLQLPGFLYELSKTNKSSADQLYAEALAAYRAAPMDQFLYLSSYPFGNSREAGEMPGYTFYAVPADFVPNQALQRQFVQTLLARIETTLAEPPAEPAEAYRYSEQAQMWLAVTRLEKQIQSSLPDLFDATVRAREKLSPMLTASVRPRVQAALDRDNAPKRSFDELVEAAEKLDEVNRRDRDLTMAITGSSKGQTVERVISVIDKISDAGVRASLLNWFYYFRTQELIASKQLVEARRLATKVAELDQRAYLFMRIAEESLKESKDKSEAHDLLNEIANDVAKAPKTIVSARALLALAYLYAKVDTNRGVEELGKAVNTINALESPDFSQQFVMMKIEGKTFGSYAAFSTPGFNPENAFREMGKLDFDGSLVQSANFSDKSLRALTTLSVIEPCFTAGKQR
jgi:hypothetical protein